MTELTVNDHAHAVSVNPDTSLLWVLSDVLGLKGTKFGCGVGICGIYMVLIDGESNHDTGVGYAASMLKPPKVRKLTIAPGVAIAFDGAAVADASETPQNDLGRYEITLDPADRWKYKTPTLRNISLTAPYMHDGSMPTLRTVVEFYNRGGTPNEGLDPLLGELELSGNELGDLVAFLEALTGGNVDALVSDAFAAPIGDVEH